MKSYKCKITGGIHDGLEFTLGLPEEITFMAIELGYGECDVSETTSIILSTGYQMESEDVEQGVFYLVPLEEDPDDDEDDEDFDDDDDFDEDFDSEIEELDAL